MHMIRKIVAVYLTILCVLVCFNVELPTLENSFLKSPLNTVQEMPKSKGTTVSLNGKTVSLGDTVDMVLSQFGEAEEILLSEYGFFWYIFSGSYKDYIQIGFSEDRVVAVYTNAENFSVCGLKFGYSRENARLILGDLVYTIKKKSAIYRMMKENAPATEGDLFFAEDAYIRVFYDVFKNDSVTAVHIIAKETEEAFDSLYGLPSDHLAESFERQSYHVTNALRVREGQKALVWSEDLKEAARAHSADMAQHNYFNHTDRQGKEVGQRLTDRGIVFRVAGENLAMGAQNPLIMHELLMNSKGHRENLLADYRFMGAGVRFREDGAPFLTQNFIIRPIA